VSRSDTPQAVAISRVGYFQGLCSTYGCLGAAEIRSYGVRSAEFQDTVWHRVFRRVASQAISGLNQKQVLPHDHHRSHRS
jgi:hypothetical protein